MLELSKLDLEQIAAALADQTDYEHRWLINPQSGEIVFWTTDCGIDGQTPVDLEELDLLGIDPLPPYVWYQDMADFAAGISDERAGRGVVIDERVVDQPLDCAAFGSGGAERVPCGQQVRVVLVQAVFEPAERALALDGPGQTAPGSLVADARGEVGHVLVPDWQARARRDGDRSARAGR